MDIRGYVIEGAISEGSRYVIHRGWRKHDRMPVLIKTAVTDPGDAAVAQERLEWEYEVKAAGYLNFDSKHVQFFRLQRLEGLFREAGFAIEDRRGRILLCGPYADFWARVLASARVLFRLNNWLADWLPFGWATDWMFALRRVPKDRHGAASR